MRGGAGRFFGALALAFALVIGCGTLATAALPAEQRIVSTPQPLKILVMGDSYSSGNGAGSYYGEKRCGKSSKNYGALFADKLNPKGLVQTVACSGDPTSAFFHRRKRRDPQLEAIKDVHPDIILFTFGGDDLHFLTVVISCLAPVTKRAVLCRPALALSRRLVRVKAVAKRLDLVIKRMKVEAPDATIVLIGYPYLERLPTYTLGSLSVGASIRAVGKQLNDQQRQVAEDNDITFVPVQGLFEGPPNHEISAAPGGANPDRWLAQPGYDGWPATFRSFYHPKPQAWAAEADLLYNTLQTHEVAAATHERSRAP